ncbi:MAG: Uroporphyrin-III C/tetrapyrrole (Corrin/Porphyrin) methyltransferase, partial [Sphingobacteriales bacterium]|nr:Uroporphyrin-III C/tetrapyrrole (Corrin/Porphyrin) methyltransferase [Sphingobacteriales bacterium]
SRELTKMFEETVRGKLSEIKTHYETHILKGEFVLCVSGYIQTEKTKNKYKLENN